MMGAAKRLRRIAAENSGAAALEFALVLPILAVFMFGAWWFGWAANCGSEVRHAVELASRIYITDPTATDTDLRTAVASHLLNVPISSVTLATSDQTIGTATSKHISWSYQTTVSIPFVPATTVNFSGASDVPLATP